jgi:hypothetical protein
MEVNGNWCIPDAPPQLVIVCKQNITFDNSFQRTVFWQNDSAMSSHVQTAKTVK